jgi:2-polyprenyl-3-methyl-5-hydroxy-6-metoxy-1,4-benzoquinol methylase
VTKEKCILCGSSDLEVIFRDKDRLLPVNPGEFRLVKCRNCGLACTLPYADPEDVARYYPDDYYLEGGWTVPHYGTFVSAICERQSRILWRRITGSANTPAGSVFDMLFMLFTLPFYRIRNRCFPYKDRAGKLLDIGCGAGRGLAEQKALGWETYGVELGEKASAYARGQLKLDIRVGRVEDASFHDDHFDVISMHHVLEHLLDPAAQIERARRMLKPGGILVISVPDLDAPERVIFGKRWGAYDLPRHRFHFTVGVLKDLLERTGFTARKTAAVMNISNMILALRYLAEDAGAPSFIKRFFRVDNKALRVLLFPLAAALRITGHGGEIMVYAMKDGDK